RTFKSTEQSLDQQNGKDYRPTRLTVPIEGPTPFTDNPKSNRISFRWIFFVLIDGTYYLSDAPAISQFGNMAEAMNLGFVYPAGKYEYLVDKLKNTSMPQEFYKITD
ncbi:hypothetical protein P4C99_21025, partial [Pontiellaceae bacterium B1224]|nr:hypothetical protein [Pontiellaceae bacterium B1224]